MFNLNLKETGFAGLVAAVGTALSVAVGGWDGIVVTLVSFLIADYITGVLSAIRNKRLSSDVMFWGGIRKGLTMAVIAIAVRLDQMGGNAQPIFRTLACYYYIGREGVSVAENLGLLGVSLPKWLTGVLAQLQEKGDQTIQTNQTTPTLQITPETVQPEEVK